VLLLIDKRLWGRFAAAALCADAAAEIYIYEFGIAAGLVVALGNILEQLVGAALVRWWCGTPFRLRGVRDVLALALFAGGLSPMIGATMGAATLRITGVEDFRPAWLLWWLGDSIGVLIVAPLVLAIIQGSGESAALTPRRIWEAIVLLGVLAGSAHLFLTGQVPISFVMSPPLIWVALRFGIRGAAVALAFLVVMKLIYLSTGFEPFARPGFSPFWRTVYAQLFLGVASVSTLLLAALTEQRDHADQELKALARALDKRVAQRTSALRNSEELLSLALESAGAAEWSWDIIRNRLSWSPRYRELYGFAQDEPGDFRAWIERVHPDDRERLEQRVNTMLATPGDDIWREEFRIVHPTRGLLWLAGNGRMNRSANGAAVRLTGINYDITDRRRAETELRLHQVAQARLSRLGAVGGLAAGIAHEINQPLMAARTYARLVAESLGLPVPVLSDARSSAEKVVAQVERAAEVMRRLREFIQFGRSSMEPVRLAPIVESALALMQPEIEGAGITVRKKIDADLPMVMADAAQVEQVLLNLLRNSVEAFRGGGAKEGNLSIECRRADKFAEICVSDTGPGFSSETPPGPSQPFMTTKPDGLGFGLSFSRSIVEAHGGRLWVGENRPGAAVYFTLPLAEQAAS
jgi:PAS domain S-box-containing protein